MKNIVKFFKTPCLQNYENSEDVLEIIVNNTWLVIFLNTFLIKHEIMKI